MVARRTPQRFPTAVTCTSGSRNTALCVHKWSSPNIIRRQFRPISKATGEPATLAILYKVANVLGAAPSVSNRRVERCSHRLPEFLERRPTNAECRVTGICGVVPVGRGCEFPVSPNEPDLSLPKATTFRLHAPVAWL